MTQEQREKLWYIAGQIEGLAYGIENQLISDGLNQAVEAIGSLLEEDGTDENA